MAKAKKVSKKSSKAQIKKTVVAEQPAKATEPVPQKEVRKVNWTVTLLMSIFFGWLGVDRFIMGHVLLGILKLITLGGCGIWWLIDLILIASKHKFQGIEWVVE